MALPVEISFCRFYFEVCSAQLMCSTETDVNPLRTQHTWIRVKPRIRTLAEIDAFPTMQTLTFSQSIWVRGFRLASGQLSPCAIAIVQRVIGKTRSFSKRTTRDWGKTAQNLSVSNSFSWGIQEKTFVPSSIVRRFFSSPSCFPLVADHCAAESPRRRGDVTRRWGFMSLSKFCWTRNRCGCDFFCDKSWGFLPVSEVSLIAQRSEVCTHCHDGGQTNTQAATPSGSSKLVGTRSPETTTNLSKDDPTLYVHFCSSPLCSLSFLVCRRETDCWPSLSWYQWNGHIRGWVPSEVAVVFRLLNGLPDGQRLKSAGGFPSKYISFGQEQNDKKWNEGRQAKSLSFEKFKFPRSLAILWRSRKAKVAPRPVKWPRAQILWEKGNACIRPNGSEGLWEGIATKKSTRVHLKIERFCSTWSRVKSRTWFVARRYVKFWFCNTCAALWLDVKFKNPGCGLSTFLQTKKSVRFPSPCAQIEKVRVTPNRKTTKVRKNSATSRDRSEARVYVVYVPR